MNKKIAMQKRAIKKLQKHVYMKFSKKKKCMLVNLRKRSKGHEMLETVLSCLENTTKCREVKMLTLFLFIFNLFILFLQM